MINPGKIGIDLGTTFSCCGVFKNGIVELISYNEGTRTIPSHVSYNPDDDKIVVGNAAKDNPTTVGNNVYDSKRFIGRRFDDTKLQNDMKYWPFKVIKGDNGQPLVEMKHKGQTVHLTASNISTEILKKIKMRADEYLGQDSSKPTEAVITVPAYFNIQQRHYTIKAAEDANLKVIKIINEPTAAAVAYAYQRLAEEIKKKEVKEKHKDEETLLIYDFGGGTFDVSIIRINFKSQKIRVLATAGDSHLGGENIDQNLVEYFLQKYKEKTGKDLEDKKMYKLKKECEKAKCLLSTEGMKEAIVNCDTLEDADVDCTLTKEDFDRINKEIFDETMKKVDEVLESAELSNSDIDFIVLVGGSSRIQKVQELLRNKFPPTTVICKDINPDEVVANGACLFANIDNKKEATEKNETNAIKNDISPQKLLNEIQDVITHSIYTDVINEDGEPDYRVLIKKNTPIPYTCDKPICFANADKGDEIIDINIFEDEDEDESEKKVEYNCDPFKIPIKNVEEESYRIRVFCDVDSNGMLKTIVKDVQADKIENHSINFD